MTDTLDPGEAFDRAWSDLMLAVNTIVIPDDVPAFSINVVPHDLYEVGETIHRIVRAAGLTNWPPNVTAAFDRVIAACREYEATSS